MLSQVQNSQERVIAYASRVLSKSERKYCVIRKELLAVVTFVQHSDPIFSVATLTCGQTMDHCHGYRISRSQGQLTRCLERLQKFDFKITHRPGQKHGNADAKSRRPCSQCGRPSHVGMPDPEVSKQLVVAAGELEGQPLSSTSLQDLRQLQVNDDTVGPFAEPWW